MHLTVSAAPCWTEPSALTLFGEERFLVERSHRGRPRAQRSDVTQAAVTGIRVAVVQLRLNAEWTLTTGHAPLEVLSPSPFVFTFEEAEFTRGVLHTLPLLHTNTQTHTHILNVASDLCNSITVS